MESQNKEEQKVLQMNELFDELLDDAYEFSKDIAMSINLMPFASAFLFVYALGFSWYSFVYLKDDLMFWRIPQAFLISAVFYLSYYVYNKSREFKKKYSTLFKLKEELDAMKES